MTLLLANMGGVSKKADLRRRWFDESIAITRGGDHWRRSDNGFPCLPPETKVRGEAFTSYFVFFTVLSRAVRLPYHTWVSTVCLSVCVCVCA